MHIQKWWQKHKAVLSVGLLFAVLGVFFSPGNAFAAQPFDNPPKSANWVNQSTIEYNGRYFVDAKTTDNLKGFANYKYIDPKNSSCVSTITLGGNLVGTGQPTATQMSRGSIQLVQDKSGTCSYVMGSATSGEAITVNGTSPAIYEISFYRENDPAHGNQLVVKNHRTKDVFVPKTINGRTVYVRQGESAPCVDMVVQSSESPTGWVLFAVDSTGGNGSENYRTFSGTQDKCTANKGAAEGYYEVGLLPKEAYNGAAYQISMGSAANSGASPSSVANLGGNNPKMDGAVLAASSEPKAPSDTCKGGALGWVFCPLITGVQKMIEVFTALINYFLKVNPLPLDTNQPMYKAWSNIRNLANIAFVIAFFIIIFSQATSVGLSNYGIKKLLPKLALVAIATNLSYFFCSFLIDTFNILGVGIAGILDAALAGSPGVTLTSGTEVFSTVAALGLITFAITTGAVVELVPFIVTAGLAVLIAITVLAVRQALIVLLVVISPLLFVALLLPNTEKWGKKGIDLFVTLLLMYPIIIGVFKSSEVASVVLTNNSTSGADGSFLQNLLGFLIFFAPLFILPFLFKMGTITGGILGRVAGMANDRSKGLVDRSRNRMHESKFYQRREMAKNNRKEERRRGAVEDYSQIMSGTGLRARRFQGKAAGLRNKAGRQRAYYGAEEALDKLQKGEESQARYIMEKKGIAGDAAYAAIASTRAGGTFVTRSGESIGVTDSLRQAALNNLSSNGRVKALRNLQAGNVFDPATGDYREFRGGDDARVSQTMIDRAVVTNPGSIPTKAPDLVPSIRESGPAAAFTGLKPREVAGFDPTTIKEAEKFFTANPSERPEFLTAMTTALNSELRGEIKADQLKQVHTVYRNAVASGVPLSQATKDTMQRIDSQGNMNGPTGGGTPPSGPTGRGPTPPTPPSGGGTLNIPHNPPPPPPPNAGGWVPPQ